MIDLLEGKIVVGKYRLERLLARGGMGSVWVARHLQLDCSVAIKFMDPELAADVPARMRFEREAKAAAQLRTPHVVQVYDHGVDDGTPYIVMELLEGEDLGARLKRQRRLAMPAMAAILDQLAKGLQRAHDAGILHRDLKPGNIFLAKSDDGDVVKILDFGIAKAVGSVTVSGSAGDPLDTSEPTQTGQILGTAHYMSPEQTRAAKNIDLRSDLWAVGVIVYRAITGEQPFRGEAFVEIVVAICTSEVPPASSKAPHLPASVDRFFERALARDPAQRFQRAREMAAAFAAIAESVTDPHWPRSEQETRPNPSTCDIVAPAVGPAIGAHGARPLELVEGTLTNAGALVSARAGGSRLPAAFWIATAACAVLLTIGGIALVLRAPSGSTARSPDARLSGARGSAVTAVVAATPPAASPGWSARAPSSPPNPAAERPTPSPEIERGGPIAASATSAPQPMPPLENGRLTRGRPGVPPPKILDPTPPAAAPPRATPPPTAAKEEPNLGY